MKGPCHWKGIYGCQSISSYVKRDVIKSWKKIKNKGTPLLARPPLLAPLLHAVPSLCYHNLCHLLHNWQKLCITYYSLALNYIQLVKLASQQSFILPLSAIRLKSLLLFPIYRVRTCSHRHPSRLLLRPVTSLPGGAGRWVHREEQAGDADLPLHPSHTDILQVQRRVGSPGRPPDRADCRPGNRYPVMISTILISVVTLVTPLTHDAFECLGVVRRWLWSSAGLLVCHQAHLSRQSHNKHNRFSLRNLPNHLGDLFVCCRHCAAVLLH